MRKYRGNIILVAAIAILALAQVGRAQVQVGTDGDWQFWTHEQAMFKITDKVHVSVGAMYRFGDDFSDLWYQHYDMGVGFQVAKWLCIKPSYRLKLVDAADFGAKFPGDKWLRIHNPSLNFVFTHKVGKFKLKNNCRFAYWDFDDGFTAKKADQWYYRNIFMAIGPAWTKAKVKPYIKEDFFFSTDREVIDRNRLSTGVMFGKSKTVTPSLYIMWQAFNPKGLGDGDNADNYIVGLDFKAKF
ncbi:MAG: DUF2490 domain-containing protein [Verrucomicrobiota bacterium]